MSPKRGPQPIRLPRVMGHRGAAGLAPENTLASLRKAAELGVTWVEFDVMLSGDGRPVLFHDDNLKRLAGVDALVAETPLARLQALDVGAWFAPAFAGETVPTLEAALELAAALDLSVNVEIKPTPGRDVETAEAVLETVAVWRNRDRREVMVSSFSRMSLAVARVLEPDLPRALISWHVPEDWRPALEALGCTSYHVSGEYVTADRIADIKRAGYAVAAFTVNDETKALALAAGGVDCLITDVPDRIAAVLPAGGA